MLRGQGAPGRRREGLLVDDNAVQNSLFQFNVRIIHECAETTVLIGCERLPRIEVRGNAYIVEKRRGDLLPEGGLIGFPSETSDTEYLFFLVPNSIHSSANSVTIRIVRITQSQER